MLKNCGLWKSVLSLHEEELNKATEAAIAKVKESQPALATWNRCHPRKIKKLPSMPWP
jgi:hypothetical protein